jgi:hypothetical protein
MRRRGQTLGELGDSASAAPDDIDLQVVTFRLVLWRSGVILRKIGPRN